MHRLVRWNRQADGTPVRASALHCALCRVVVTLVRNRDANIFRLSDGIHVLAIEEAKSHGVKHHRKA